jgi:hypothetical protein
MAVKLMQNAPLLLLERQSTGNLAIFLRPDLAQHSQAPIFEADEEGEQCDQ